MEPAGSSSEVAGNDVGAVNTTRGASDRSISQGLDRGLVLLDLLAANEDGLTISELATGSGAHRTVVSRLLRTLAARGYVLRAETGRYILGGRLLELSRFIQPTIRSAALPVLQSLCDKVQATAHLTMADGDEAVALIVVEPTIADYHVSYRVGSRRPLWRGASGVAILSTRSPNQAELPEVSSARERGWAWSRGHLEQGMYGIATPLPHLQYSNYSTGVVMLGAPDDDTRDSIASEVMAAAERIVKRLIS